MMGNLARHSAMDFLTSRIFGEDDTLDGPPSLYEMLLGILMKSLAGAGASFGGSAGGGSSGSGGGGVQGHHVIPEYMCGASKQFDLVNLSIPVHSQLHAKMFSFDRAITIGSITYNVLFRKKNNKDILFSPVNKLARTQNGRKVIGVSLGIFYGEEDLLFSGSGKKTGLPLGIVLAEEAFEFGKKPGNHKYSRFIPCKKGN